MLALLRRVIRPCKCKKRQNTAATAWAAVGMNSTYVERMVWLKKEKKMPLAVSLCLKELQHCCSELKEGKILLLLLLLLAFRHPDLHLITM